MNLELLNHPLAQEAAKFAALRHAQVGQLRKYTSQPYIVHPSEVAAFVSDAADADVVMVAAAYLHDVLEDTDALPHHLDALFPPMVCRYVDWLTDIEYDEGAQPPREERKRRDRERIAGAPAKVKTIKICDLISNTSTIATYADPKYALKYLGEKRLLLDEALRGGDEGLWLHASQLCRRATESVKAAIARGDK